MQLFLQSAYLSSLLSVVYIGLLYRSHPDRRLPMAPILATFAVGMVCVVPVLLFYRMLPWIRPEGLWGAVLVAPIVEEGVKLAALMITVRRLGYPNLIDALDYGIFFGILGVGFAIYEDFWYIFGRAYPSWIAGDTARFLEVFRWMAYARSFPGHLLFNAVAGLVLGLGVCRQEPRRLWISLAAAYLVAVAAHALFNLAAQQQGTVLLWTVCALYLGVFLGLRRHALARSPWVTVKRWVEGEHLPWNHTISPVQALFAEGFSWPGKHKAQLLPFYPLVLSLLILFPMLVSVVYFLHRLVSMGLPT